VNFVSLNPSYAFADYNTTRVQECLTFPTSKYLDFSFSLHLGEEEIVP
jgi:hypothetical protein